MARGVRTLLGADIGISVSGIAGPGGGLPEKPVGTTWIGLSARDGDWARKFIWNGDRRSPTKSPQHRLHCNLCWITWKINWKMGDPASSSLISANSEWRAVKEILAPVRSGILTTR